MRQAEHHATRRAREVVGLYGDPDATWGILLDAELEAALDPETVPGRLAGLAAAYPHLGPALTPRTVALADWEATRAEVAGTPFDHGPLVRLLVAEDRTRVLVAAHHGVCDGLGLVAILAATTGLDLGAAARGIGERRSRRGFVASSVRRIAEALLRPPPRFGDPSAGGRGEVLVQRTLPLARRGTLALCAAVAETYRSREGAGTQPLLVIGASRRQPGALAPDRQTGYLRFRYDPSWTPSEAAEAFARLEPEPDFPETSARGTGPRVTRVLRSRLGATAQLSNLGPITGAGVRSVAMFPALSGPRAVAVGLASTASTTTLSLRTRAEEFGDAAALLDEIAGRLLAQ